MTSVELALTSQGATTAPVRGIEAVKDPCLCGCIGINIPWFKKVRATPEFKGRLDQDINTMLVKVKQIRTSGQQPRTLDLIPPRHEIVAPPVIATAEQLTRLQTLTQQLQQPASFVVASGSFPAAVQWTSTVLTTVLIDYSHLTGDSQYFNNIVAFFNNQPVMSLIRQQNDDKLWVVLTWLRGAAYASIHDKKWVNPFRDRAKFFYKLASTGWDNTTCGGGMYWGPCSSYKNAVTTELYITASVGMYEAFGDNSYLEAAVRGWTWFERSGMINAEGLVNDGLDKNCKNNGQTTWTYNQGIVLSGLSKLYKHTGDANVLKAAQNLLDAVLASPLVTSSGVLVETCDPTGTCDQDQWMFKGVFFEHLGYFLADMAAMDELPVPIRLNLVRQYGNFIQANAQAVWNVARGQDGEVGSWWAAAQGGPRQVSVESNGSGVAAVCCAVRVDKLLESLQTASNNTGNVTAVGTQGTMTTAVQTPEHVVNRRGENGGDAVV